MKHSISPRSKLLQSDTKPSEKDPILERLTKSDSAWSISPGPSPPASSRKNETVSNLVLTPPSPKETQNQRPDSQIDKLGELTSKDPELQILATRLSSLQCRIQSLADDLRTRLDNMKKTSTCIIDTESIIEQLHTSEDSYTALETNVFCLNQLLSIQKVRLVHLIDILHLTSNNSQSYRVMELTLIKQEK